MKTQKIICTNSFHNATCTVIAKNGKLSAHQIKKIEKSLCGMADCCCGGLNKYTDSVSGSKIILEPNYDGGATIIN